MRARSMAVGMVLALEAGCTGVTANLDLRLARCSPSGECGAPEEVMPGTPSHGGISSGSVLSFTREFSSDLPDANARTYVTLEIRPAAIESGATIEVHGVSTQTLTNSFGTPGGPPPPARWAPDDPSSDVLGGAVGISCFCEQTAGDAEQRLDGSLRIDEASPDRLRGSLTLEIDGIVPGFSIGRAAGTAVADFDLARR